MGQKVGHAAAGLGRDHEGIGEDSCAVELSGELEQRRLLDSVHLVEGEDGAAVFRLETLDDGTGVGVETFDAIY